MGKARGLIVGLLLLLNKAAFSQQLRLGNNPYTVEKSAVLELVSNNQGLLLPRIADTSLINVLNPPDGMIIFYVPIKQLMIRTNGSWQEFALAGSGVTSLNGNTGALTMDTGYINNFYQKVRTLLSATAPITYNSTSGLIGITQSTTSTNGYLSSTDWNIFNSKAPATGGTGYIQNQTASAQTGGFNINGNGLIGGNVGIGTVTPAASSALDIASTTKGLLAPRMTTAQKAAIASPATGLLVYDTTLGGFYFYDGSGWVAITSGNTTITSWQKTGNAGTDPSINFVGTTDAQDLVFKANNTERARIISSSGDIKIGDATSGTLKATTELVLRQDGDTYGPSILRSETGTRKTGLSLKRQTRQSL